MTTQMHQVRIPDPSSGSANLNRTGKTNHGSVVDHISSPDGIFRYDSVFDSYGGYESTDEVIPSPGNEIFIPKISVIIPTLNEELNIPHVFPKIPTYVDEIVVVDSSSDNTPEVIRKHAPHAKIIQTEPKGKGNALKIGFQNATGDIIIMLDADGSMDPAEISLFVEPLLDGHDVVQGSRILGESEDLTAFRRFGNFFFVSLVNLMFDCNYTDMCYGYRAFKKAVIDQIDFDSDGFDVETELTIKTRKNGFRICEVPSQERNRIHGQSNLRTFRDGWKILYRIFKEWRN